jgi:hypothetical protein
MWRQPTATRNAARDSFALPAATKNRAFMLPPSDFCASAIFNATLLAARINWSASDRSRFLIAATKGRSPSIN